MKQHFFTIKPDGRLHYVPNMPEPPLCKNYKTKEKYHYACNKYESDLKIALSQSIPVDNEQQVENLIIGSGRVAFMDDLKPGEIYHLECKVEKIFNGCNGIFVAVVSPIDKNETQECTECIKKSNGEHLNSCSFYNKEQPKQEELTWNIKGLPENQKQIALRLANDFIDSYFYPDIQAKGQNEDTENMKTFVFNWLNHWNIFDIIAKSVSLPHQESSDKTKNA